jgi:hypothetical protein
MPERRQPLYVAMISSMLLLMLNIRSDVDAINLITEAPDVGYASPTVKSGI